MHGQKVNTMKASRLHMAMVLRLFSYTAGPNGIAISLQLSASGRPPFSSCSLRRGLAVVTW